MPGNSKTNQFKDISKKFLKGRTSSLSQESSLPKKKRDSNINVIGENLCSSSTSSELGICAVSEVYTVPQEHGRPNKGNRLYSKAMLSPNQSLQDVTTSITSITSSISRATTTRNDWNKYPRHGNNDRHIHFVKTSIEREPRVDSKTFRTDFNEFKCKMRIFGESLNLCKCIASDFKNKMKWMEKRLDNLEKRHKLTKQESNYSSIIQKNKAASQKCLNIAKKLQMCGTEEEMREVAAKICRNYLHGAWKNIDPTEMFFQRISGGLSNFLYLVGLPDDPAKLAAYQTRESTPEDEDVKSPSFSMEEPKNVLLRIYGQVHGERAMDAIVTESVIFTLLSERKLGPRLYGVFSGGRIEEYIPARALHTKELGDPAISMKIAEKMAAIHTLALPLSKDPDWIWKNCYKWLKALKADQAAGNHKSTNPEENRIIKMMSAVDFEKELKWLKKFLSTVESPVVFCHNDMQEGNILLFEDSIAGTQDVDTCEGGVEGVHKEMSAAFEDGNTSDSMLSRMSDSGEPRMVFIDYEYCAYNYRGFDIANHFQEWALDYTNPVHPFYYFNEDDYPTLEQKEIFIKEYLKHYNANQADHKDSHLPTVEQINQVLTEVEAFALSSNLLWTLWSCVNAPKSQIPFGYWEYSQTRLDQYYRLKQEVIKKGDGVALKRKIHEVDI